MKVAYMFPGQGSQHKGMGVDLIPKYQHEFEQASGILGYDLKNICVNNPNEKLSSTLYAQPALYFINCLSYLEELALNNDPPDYVCGHSLGEYSALFAANVFDLFTGLKNCQA